MEKIIDEDKTVDLSDIDTKEENNYVIMANYAIDNKKYNSLHSILQAYNYIIEPNYNDDNLTSSFIAYLYTLDNLNIKVLQRYIYYNFSTLALHLLDLDEDYIPPFKRLIQVYNPSKEVWSPLLSEMEGRMKFGLKDYRELIDYLSPYVKQKSLQESLQESKDVTLLGPSNVLDKIIDNPNCAKGEGCHLFLCNHITDNDEDEEPKDWFLGYCQFCHSSISSRYQALRFPFRGGGWLGCYCSIYCVSEDRPDKEVGTKRTKEAMEKIVEEINMNKK
jgi:hypothetical protein